MRLCTEVNMSGTDREYLSPDYKLIACFKKSRDGWKKKAQEAQRKLRKVTERLKQVRVRRDYWREEALQGPPAELRRVKNRAPRGRACSR